jgi:hypothetical protein
MPTEFQYDVFLSHNSKDKPRVLLGIFACGTGLSRRSCCAKAEAEHRRPLLPGQCGPPVKPAPAGRVSFVAASAAESFLDNFSDKCNERKTAINIPADNQP